MRRLLAHLLIRLLGVASVAAIGINVIETAYTDRNFWRAWLYASMGTAGVYVVGMLEGVVGRKEA